MPTAFLVGHTGKTGRALCRALAKEKYYSRIALVGRKSVDTSEFGPEFESVVVDFSALKPDDFQGFDDGFCSLGARPSQVSREVFASVDRDAVIRVAEMAKKGGCKHYHLVTAKGVSPSSSLFYNRIKYEGEEGVRKCEFDQLTIYRPGMILYDRSENDRRTQAMQNLFKPFEWALPSRITTPIDVMIKAMLIRMKSNDTGELFLEPSDMLHLCKKAEKSENSAKE